MDAATRLKEAEAKLKSTALTGDTAWLRISDIIVPIIDAWSDEYTAACGLDSSSWAARVTGRPRAATMARKRKDAMEKVEAAVRAGPRDRDVIRYKMGDKVIMYLAYTMPGPSMEKAILAVIHETVARDAILDYGTARRIARIATGMKDGQSVAKIRLSRLEEWLDGEFDRWMSDAIKAAKSGNGFDKKLSAPPGCRKPSLKKTMSALGFDAE